MTDEEQVEHRVGMTALAEQIKTLVASHGEIKMILREMQLQAAEAERRSVGACKSCDLRSVCTALSERVGILEREMAGLTGRMAGISIAAAALSFLAAFFVRKG